MILGEHLDQSRPETAPWTFWLHEPVCSSFPGLCQLKPNQPRSQVSGLPCVGAGQD